MKKAGIVIGMILLYFVLVFAPNFLGFLSPYLWVYQPILGAFLAATPVLYVGSKWKKPGVFALFTVVVVVIFGLMGEISQPEVWAGYAVAVVLAELARGLIGYDKQMGLRIGYSLNALGMAGSLLPLWTRTSWYYAGAVEEMSDPSYAETLMKLANPGCLVLLIVLTLVCGYLGCLVSEKIFKEKVTIAKPANEEAAPSAMA